MEFIIQKITTLREEAQAKVDKYKALDDRDLRCNEDHAEGMVDAYGIVLAILKDLESDPASRLHTVGDSL